VSYPTKIRKERAGQLSFSVDAVQARPAAGIFSFLMATFLAGH
jgi:hypothetical protein